MNATRVCISTIRNTGVFCRISIPLKQSNPNIVVMQKSLLSFFKPLTDKSQINRDGSLKNNEQTEQKSTKSSPVQREKDEEKSLKQSPKSEKKNAKTSKRASKKEKKEPKSKGKNEVKLSKRSSETDDKKEQFKSFKLSSKIAEQLEKESSESSPKKDISKEEVSPIVQEEQPKSKEENEVKSSKRSSETDDKKEQLKPFKLSSKKTKQQEKKSSKSSPKKDILKEEVSPIVQRKRKRIMALESDSDEEVSVDTPKHEKKKRFFEKSESMEKGDDMVEEKPEEIQKSQPEDNEKDVNVAKQEEALENKESEDGEKNDVSENEESFQNSNFEDTKIEKKKETIMRIKIEAKKKSTAKRQTKKELKSKASVMKKVDSDIVWKKGEKTPYLSLAKTLQKVEETSARLKIIDILAEYFRKVILSNKADLLPSIYLCLNTLGPAYESVELGIADTYLMKAVAQCTGRSLAQIKSDAAKIGDLGIVAEQSRSNQKLMFRPAALTVQGVFQQLSDVAKISGQNAVKRKIDKIQTLFVSCQECEARFIIRSLAGRLRIGLAEQSVIQALALACTTTPPNQDDPPTTEDASETMSAAEFKKRAEEELLILKTTYCECPNYNLIVPALFEHGVQELPKFCKITPGIPVKPMLAHPTKGVHEVFQRFDNIKFTCEWKYDGERAQIHVLEDGSIKIYSRNQEDNTSKYPDIINDIPQTFKSDVKSCIIDTESVAWDREQKKIMPFQILSTRKRKDADVNEIKVRVCVFLFDLLYLNGESLTQKPLSERRKLLKEYFQEVEDKFKFVTSMDTNTMEEVQEFLDDSVKGNCEGLMVKTLETEATYEIAKRSRNWLKLKKDYLDGCGDTLDLVVIGGYIGKGKRTGQYGGFLLASYDADNDEYQTICKIGTGFTEEALAKHSDFLKQHVIENAKPYYRYDESQEPDHWFDAVVVWEVKCADLSLSPIYFSGIGLVDPEKGISLRFPRFLRTREDKTVEQATSSQQVADLYKNQDQIKNNASANESKFNEKDF